ncbi:lysylphosphatidylglycerol synthase transmembrane domain-containing protein [Roseivirga sp. BDSF3-8]|uniref:lysylphosphatidylglycerol synthase transmembrane domain-containing protein n=1 Tax=Roseivirga sp. BDSF3-8 TaxID=3241598 RepID=UPI0035320036
MSVKSPLLRKAGQVAKYLISAGLGIGLLWYLFQKVDTDGFIDRVADLNYSWIVLSIVLSLLSHWARAYRWNLMLEPQGFRLKSYRSFLAVMSGYLGNLAVPRMGELFRCMVLKRTDDVPVTNSFGAVVAERVLDLLILIAIIGSVLLLEQDKIQTFITGYISENVSGVISSIPGYLPGVVAFSSALLVLAFFLFRRKIRKTSLYIKVRSLLSGVIEGFVSIRKVKKPLHFWGSTFIIWLMYYLMSYVIVFTMPETSSLPAIAGLSILMMGGLGMAAPVQGGFGTYHLMVSAILVIYGIGKSDGLFFATVLHTSQTVAVILFGGISALTALFVKRRSAQTPHNDEDIHLRENLQPQPSS